MLAVSREGVNSDHDRMATHSREPLAQVAELRADVCAVKWDSESTIACPGLHGTALLENRLAGGYRFAGRRDHVHADYPGIIAVVRAIPTSLHFAATSAPRRRLA